VSVGAARSARRTERTLRPDIPWQIVAHDCFGHASDREPKPRAGPQRAVTGGAAHNDDVPAAPDNLPDSELEQAILRLLAARSPGATICPSEAARAVAAGGSWRQLMAAARAAAGRLAGRGDVQITQAGRVVELASARGPIRIRRSH